MRLSLHRTALLFWCRLFRYFRAASHGKTGCAPGCIRQRIFPFLAVLRPPLHASFFHSELRPLLLCGAYSAHHRRGIKAYGMDANQAFHLCADCSHLRPDLSHWLALGLLQTQKSRHLIFQVPALIFLSHALHRNAFQEYFLECLQLLYRTHNRSNFIIHIQLHSLFAISVSGIGYCHRNGDGLLSRIFFLGALRN